MEITAQQSIADGTMDEVPRTWIDIFEPVAVYLHTILSRIRNSLVEEDMRVFVKDVHSMIQEWRQRLGDSSAPNARRMHESIELALRLVQREEERSRRQNAHAEETRRLDMAAGSMFDISVPAAAYYQGDQIDGPGHLSIAGIPRHDNDHVDVAEISIAPTSDEVLCDKRPYLPHNGRNAPHHLPDDLTARHLDIHFRLLREDFMHSIRESCQAWQQTPVAVQTSKLDRFFYDKSSFVFMYKNLKLHSITVDQRQGVTIMVEFDDIVQLKNLSRNDRADFWKRSKRLGYGSLLCITWTLPTGESRLAFITVNIRDENHLAGRSARDTQGPGGNANNVEGKPQRPTIGLGTLSEEGRSDLLRALLDPVACCNMIMLQVFEAIVHLHTSSCMYTYICIFEHANSLYASRFFCVITSYT